MPPTRTPNIAVFRIQPVNGRLRFSTLVNTPTPVDVEFGSIVQLSFPGTAEMSGPSPDVAPIHNRQMVLVDRWGWLMSLDFVDAPQIYGSWITAISAFSRHREQRRWC
jgi:hypothetical protein